jgi:hypothetical protein
VVTLGERLSALQLDVVGAEELDEQGGVARAAEVLEERAVEQVRTNDIGDAHPVR